MERSFKNIEEFVDKSILYNDTNKYNVVVGLINEIIEIYGMKVIIICNSDALGECLVHNILKSKLNCIEYKKIITPKSQKSILDDCLENTIITDEGKQKKINKYIENNEKKLVDNIIFDNLRFLGGLIDAFIATVNLFDEKYIENEILNSIFYSLIVTHFMYYDDYILPYNLLKTGSSIEFLLRCFYAKSELLEILNKGEEVIKWIDISISGYWIHNLTVP